MARPTYSPVFYEVHHQRSTKSLDDFVKVGYGTHKLEEAAAQRKVTGDLVVEMEAGRAVRVCTDPSWLWDSEKDNPNSYAQRAINDQKAIDRKEAEITLGEDKRAGAQ